LIAIDYIDKSSDYKVNGLTLQLQPKPFYKDVTKDCEITQNYSIIQIEFTNVDGNIKINYVD
jgi:hypothetical protein